MIQLNSVICADCLKAMPAIPDKSIDMILCDLPYQIIACKWDIIIPFDKLWENYKRIIKEQGVIVLFSIQPFTTKLINSNETWFTYEWIWKKESGTGFLLSKTRPMPIHENILIFSSPNNLETNKELREYFYNEKRKAGVTNKQINHLLGYATSGSGMAGHYFKNTKEQFMLPDEKDYIKIQKFTKCFKIPYKEIKIKYENKIIKYNPQMRKGKKYIVKQGSGSAVYQNKDKGIVTINNGTRYPISILEFNRDKARVHPTQKPVAVCEYLIKTYTNENDIVLDNCAGSGTTAIASLRTNRQYICIEKEQKYVDIINNRISSYCDGNLLEYTP